MSDFATAMNQDALIAASRSDEVSALLEGAVDLHCHSGPSVMPRILDHQEALMDAAEAKFAAVVYKDHYYPGMAHATVLERLYPETGVRLFSGVALNNASGGVNPHAVDHCVKLGGKIVWMPTFSAANHIRQTETGAKSFPKTAHKMMDPVPLTVLDANKKLTDDAKHVLDIIAAGNIILAGGHLHISELLVLFEEAKRRGVKKMLVNHPTYIVGCNEAEMRDLVALGAYLEHSICMFLECRVKHFEPQDLVGLVKNVGADKTILGSDLGLTQAPRPVDGFRQIVAHLLALQFSTADIRKLISTNAAGLLDLPVAGHA